MVQRRFYSFVVFFIIFAILSTTFNNCAQNPQVTEESARVASFKHTTNITSCSTCHTPDRPRNAAFVHYNNQDCATCHFIPPATWSEHSWHLRNPAAPTCAQCHQKDQPAAVNGVVHYNNADCVNCHKAPLTAGITWQDRKPYAHTPTPNSCIACHEKDRPGALHWAGRDCVQCHNTRAW